jgi:hypothetical protein
LFSFSFPLFLFPSTPSMYHSLQLCVCVCVCVCTCDSLPVAYQETSKGKGWGSVLGKARHSDHGI